MPRRLQPAIAAAALACSLAYTLPAVAEAVYKWVDDKGVTHFSQTPPDSTQAQKLEVRTAPAAAAQDNAAADAKKDADAKPQRTEAQKKERAERCKNAQEALEKLMSPEPVVRYGEKGEQIPVADDERPAFVEQVKKVIAQQCGD
jgi:uncharacterized protein DUF4124